MISGKRIIAAGLSVTLLCTNVLFAHLPEKNIWEQRRIAAISSSVRLTHLGNTPLPHFHGRSPISDLIAQLSVHGTIRDIQPASEAKNPNIIVYIQDIHGQPEAQRNISSMILSLLEKDPQTLIGLEGSVGDFPLNRFRHADLNVNKAVGSFFFNTGFLTGPEYAGFAAKTTPRFFGVEDKNLYLKNVAAVREALPLQKKDLEAIQAVEQNLQLKNPVFILRP